MHLMSAPPHISTEGATGPGQPCSVWVEAPQFSSLSSHTSILSPAISRTDPVLNSCSERKRELGKRTTTSPIPSIHFATPFTSPCCPDQHSAQSEPQLLSGPLPGLPCAATLPPRPRMASPRSLSTASMAPTPLLWYDDRPPSIPPLQLVGSCLSTRSLVNWLDHDA